MQIVLTGPIWRTAASLLSRSKKNRIFVILIMVVFAFAQPNPSAAEAILSTSIVDVVVDTSVTIRAYNFPANQTFTVTMGLLGTKGINGTLIGTTYSGDSGSFEATYIIPDNLEGQSEISIRLESPEGYFAYDWFYNSTGNTAPESVSLTGYQGYPITSVINVIKDSSVTVRLENLPASQVFSVTMGIFGTKGVHGIHIADLDTLTGGSQEVVFIIPGSLYGEEKISIRFESPQGYFAYDWFYNNTGNVPPETAAVPITSGVISYNAYPTTTILSVIADTSVSLVTHNFPPNQAFTVTMGEMGTRGVGGTVVATTDSGVGGSFEITYNIPENLSGQSLISIRLESAQGYYAYDWFVNQTHSEEPQSDHDFTRTPTQTHTLPYSPPESTQTPTQTQTQSGPISSTQTPTQTHTQSLSSTPTLTHTQNISPTRTFTPTLTHTQDTPPTQTPTTTQTPTPTTTQDSPQPVIVWKMTFETGDYSEFGNENDGWVGEITGQGSSGQATIVTSPVRSGSYASALTIDTSLSIDNENQSIDLVYYGFPPKDEYYYSVWYYIPSTVIPQEWWNIYQFMSSSGDVNNPHPIFILDGKYSAGQHYLDLIWRPDVPAQKATWNAPLPMPVDRWFHIESYVKRAVDSSGHIIIWQDGVELFNVTGFPTALSDNNILWLVNHYTDNILPYPATIYVDDLIVSESLISPVYVP